MITRESRSVPVVWVPHVMSSGHGHSHGGGRQNYNGTGRSRTPDHNMSSSYGQQQRSADGPKVFIVDYKRGANALCCASMFTIVQLAIGALNMGALIYSLSVGDLHTILCCAAFHLFSAEGILAMSYKNGWSLLMGYDNRTMCHTILQILAMILAITGMTIKLVVTGVSDSAHCIAGLVTASIAIPTIIFGPMGLFRKSKLLKTIHLFLGLATFLCASICFALALFMNKFKEWCKNNSSIVQIIMLLLLLYISLVMIILVVCKVANLDMLRAETRRK